jgi:hypothetical protein
MIRKNLMIGAILAFSILASAHPVQAQCTPVTLTVNGSGGATVSPGSTLTAAGSVSNCGTQPATISVTLTITHNGSTMASYTRSFSLQAGQTQHESTSLVVPNSPGMSERRQAAREARLLRRLRLPEDYGDVVASVGEFSR